MTARAQQGASGGRLRSCSRLKFDASGGRTRLAVRDLGAPLRVMRGFELEDGRLLVQIISAAPGLFAGDRYELSIDVAAGAKTVVLTPAATKIHSMPDGGRAEQTIDARVADGGSLEIYPTLSIPFRDSDFVQRVTAELSGDARFGWMDPWSFGRISCGEIHEYRRISTRLRIDRDQRPLYRDALDLSGENGRAGEWGMLEGASHLLSGCWFGPGELWEPRGALESPLALGRVGQDGLYARGCFADGTAFRSAVEDLHRSVAEAWGLAVISQVRFTL